jgi:hypothetical protein
MLYARSERSSNQSSTSCAAQHNTQEMRAVQRVDLLLCARRGCSSAAQCCCAEAHCTNQCRV